MTCSALISIDTLIISTFIPSNYLMRWISLQGLVMFGLYSVGSVSGLTVSAAADYFVWREHPTPPFMLELPDCRTVGLHNAASARYHGWLAQTCADFSLPRRKDDNSDHDRSPPVGATQPAINYSLAALIGRSIQPRFQLADQRSVAPGHGCTRGGGGIARNSLRD